MNKETEFLPDKQVLRICGKNKMPDGFGRFIVGINAQGYLRDGIMKFVVMDGEALHVEAEGYYFSERMEYIRELNHGKNKG